MAVKKKIWSIYEKGATYEGPLTEVEASSERSALDTAAFVYGFEGPARKRLYTVPGAKLTGKPPRGANATKKRGMAAHAAKSASEKMVAKMIGRRVKSGWHGLIDGEILQWEPFGAGGTDVLVKDAESGRLVWYASHGLKPIDGKGPLPSRTKVREIRDAEMKEDLKKIGERWAKEPPPPRIRR